MPPVARKLPPLYPIIDVRGDDADDTERAFTLALKVAGAGVSLVQLRAKQMPGGPLTALAKRLVVALDAVGAGLIVNDRADVAAAAGAAGVHLGHEDLGVREARAIVGPAALVGYSTHDIEAVRAASALPADYLGFGPVFDSPTKAGVREARGVEALRAACAVSALPVVAIGGITLERAPELWATGAASVAVISEIEHSSQPARLVAAYLKAAAS